MEFDNNNLFTLFFSFIGGSIFFYFLYKYIKKNLCINIVDINENYVNNNAVQIIHYQNPIPPPYNENDEVLLPPPYRESNDNNI
jgi:hypothetical protein